MVVVDDEVIRQRLNPIRVFAITCIGGIGVLVALGTRWHWLQVS